MGQIQEQDKVGTTAMHYSWGSMLRTVRAAVAVMLLGGIGLTIPPQTRDMLAFLEDGHIWPAISFQIALIVFAGSAWFWSRAALAARFGIDDNPHNRPAAPGFDWAVATRLTRLMSDALAALGETKPDGTQSTRKKRSGRRKQTVNRSIPPSARDRSPKRSCRPTRCHIRHAVSEAVVIDSSGWSRKVVIVRRSCLHDHFKATVNHAFSETRSRGGVCSSGHHRSRP
jgi:hypothetical protein